MTCQVLLCTGKGMQKDWGWGGFSLELNQQKKSRIM